MKNIIEIFETHLENLKKQNVYFQTVFNENIKSLGS